MGLQGLFKGFRHAVQQCYQHRSPGKAHKTSFKSSKLSRWILRPRHRSGEAKLEQPIDCVTVGNTSTPSVPPTPSRASTTSTATSVSRPTTSISESNTTASSAESLWPIASTSDADFIKLVQRHVDSDGSLNSVGLTASVTSRGRGASNFVAMVTFTGGPKDWTYVVKVPGWFEVDEWTPADARNLRSEACTMTYIRDMTHGQVPVPKVWSYDDTTDNEINSPYILMDFIEGRPAHHVWYDRDDVGALVSITPTPARQQVRLNLLQSLARAMANLQTIHFDGIGKLNFDNDPTQPIVVENFDRNNDEIYPVYKFTKEKMSLNVSPLGTQGHRRDGATKVLRHILDTPPFSNTNGERETFVLAHPDLDFQNILVDQDGNVTGIIDWDDVCTMPRCLGYSTVPLFLMEDWHIDYAYPDSLPSPRHLAIYRKAYADAMHEAMDGQGDCKYTAKSDIYLAVYLALYGNSDYNLVDITDKIITDLMGPRFVNNIEFGLELGEGDEDKEVALKELLPEYLAPTS